jgi:hypothetical protein
MNAPGVAMTTSPTPVGALAAAVRDDGFCFVAGNTMRTLLESSASLDDTPFDDWQAFAASWNTLAPDTYLARLGKHRRRRYAVFSIGAPATVPTAADDASRVTAAWTVRREPHQPHYQSLDYNVLQGDIERWFEPVSDEAAESHSLRIILCHCGGFFGALSPSVARWHAEVHQFRIEAHGDQPGQPTPEGMHRDGVDYVMVLLVDRENIASGTTTIHAEGGVEIGSFTLAKPFDTALVDDRRVFHGVTPVEPIDPGRPAHRDVLVVTLRAQPD